MFVDKISLHQKIYYVQQENKGSGNRLWFILFEKILIPHENNTPQLSISEGKLLLLTRNIWKAKFVTFFVYFRWLTKILQFFWTWSLAHSQNLYMFNTFFCSEDPSAFSTLPSLVSPHCVPVSIGYEMIPVLQLFAKIVAGYSSPWWYCW